jgi:hypothetical protein
MDKLSLHWPNKSAKAYSRVIDDTYYCTPTFLQIYLITFNGKCSLITVLPSSGTSHLTKGICANLIAWIILLRLPLDINFTMLFSTITKIQINKTLVWNTRLVGHTLEIINNIFAKANSNRLLEFRCIGIFSLHFITSSESFDINSAQC